MGIKRQLKWVNLLFEDSLTKANPVNDCLAYEKPHKAIWVFIPLE